MDKTDELSKEEILKLSKKIQLELLKVIEKFNHKLKGKKNSMSTCCGSAVLFATSGMASFYALLLKAKKEAGTENPLEIPNEDDFINHILEEIKKDFLQKLKGSREANNL